MNGILRQCSGWGGLLAHLALGLTLSACSSSSGGGGGNGDGAGDTDDLPFVAFETFQAASVVIGQPDFTSNDQPQVGEGEGEGEGDGDPVPLPDNINTPYSRVAIVDGILYVPDYESKRVIAFEGVPESNGPDADFVVGQESLTSYVEATTAAILGGPGSVVTDGEKLYIVDYDGNRLVIYDTPPTVDGASADRVVGQSDLMSAEPEGCSAQSLSNPESAFVVDGKLIVADTGAHRVLIWNSVPTSDGAEADLVLGQADFSSCGANRGSTVAANTLNRPADVWSDGTRLVVTDGANARVLIWNEFPTSNGAAADIVLGQSAMDTSTTGTSATLMQWPYFVTSNGAQLIVSDSIFDSETENHRVLIWDSFPEENGAAADKVLGQSDFSGNTANDDDQNGESDGQPSARTFNGPSGVTLIGNLLFVADTGNHRFLIFEGVEE